MPETNKLTERRFMGEAVDTDAIEHNMWMAEHISKLENEPIERLQKRLARYKNIIHSSKYDNFFKEVSTKEYGIQPFTGREDIYPTIAFEIELIERVLGDRNYEDFFESEVNWTYIV